MAQISSSRHRRAAAWTVRNSSASSKQLPAPLACQPRKGVPHCLKHSLASHLVAGNVNLALIKQALGHRSISSTMVYVGTTDAQAAELVQAALMGVF